MPRFPRRAPTPQLQWLPKWTTTICCVHEQFALEIAELARPPHINEFPAITGNGIWKASELLGRWILSGGAGRLEHRRCVEMGAGLGLAGLAAACCGAHVLLTDLPANLPALVENSRRNSRHVSAAGGTVAVAELDWGVVAAGGDSANKATDMVSSVLGGAAEVILGADISWSSGLCELLLAPILALSVANVREAGWRCTSPMRHAMVGEGKARHQKDLRHSQLTPLQD
uniref:Calmodulin-lysine N-methyltransferase n=1 Tax=Noctiluca scintillans TaxID=2966 RepID=A0A7S1FGG0_NOCSC|mmetsp:Transcript_59332/g.157964  ORF Transcript_59332/g.157964 Transcript_59332/m.157964 type:complete len:229 (+) Transcript_59332:82-768(+)